jgi:translation initiation factor IF-1
MPHLTVIRDFGDYKRGAHIDDLAEVKRLLEGEMRHHVVKIAPRDRIDVVEEESDKPAGDVLSLPKPEPEKEPS